MSRLINLSVPTSSRRSRFLPPSGLFLVPMVNPGLFAVPFVVAQVNLNVLLFAFMEAFLASVEVGDLPGDLRKGSGLTPIC